MGNGTVDASGSKPPPLVAYALVSAGGGFLGALLALWLFCSMIGDGCCCSDGDRAASLADQPAVATEAAD